MTTTTDSDILIVGAGFVGLILAFVFAEQGRRVMIIETQTREQKQQQHSEDGRALALSIQSRRILKQFNIWPQLKKFTTPIKTVEVSEQGRFGKLRFHAEDEKIPALGFVLPAPQLGAQLLALCTQHPNITWIEGTTVTEVVQTPEKVTVHLQAQEKTLSALLMIAAEGAQSLTRAQLPFNPFNHDYHQFAIVANVTLSKPHLYQAYQRFTSAATLALLPLNQTRSTLVLTVAARDYPHWQAYLDTEFLAKAQQLLGAKLGLLQDLGVRQAYPLRAVFVEQAYHQRLLLMGNAAHTLNPIAAQGLNLTLRDIAQLASLVQNCDLQSHSDLAQCLMAYQTARLPDQKKMLRFTDGLVNVLAMPHLKTLRSLGLLALDTLPFVKRRLFAHLLGA